MIAIVFFTWLFSATLFVGLTTLRWWYVDQGTSDPQKPSLAPHKPEPQRTAEDYSLLGVDLD